MFHPKAFPVSRSETHLRVLQTTDIHANLFPYDYFSDKPAPGIGLMRMSGAIQAARSETPNCLLLDTGDFLQGTPLGDLFAKENPNGAINHPAAVLMKEFGYDAGTLGNHEFNYGLEFLSKVLADPGFPIVLANAATRLGSTPDQDTTLFPPYAILTRTVSNALGSSAILRIGVIGFVPPQIAVWDRHHLQGRLHMRGIPEAARAYVPRMKAEGADLIIALCHSGIGTEEDQPFLENAAVPLAAIEGVDVVLCGHQHQRFPGAHFDSSPLVDPVRGTIHGKPAVMAGFWGSDLGVVDLALAQDENGSWSIRRHQSSLRAIAQEDTPAMAVPKSLQDHHARTLKHIRTPVAQTDQPLHSFFSHAGFDLATRAVAIAQQAHAQHLLRGQDTPLLSAASPFRAGGHAGPGNYTEVPAGPVSLRNLADLYLFPNTLSILRLTGAQVCDWLERAAGAFHEMRPGQGDQPLRNDLFPSYNCDLILGLDYEIDLTQPSRFALDGNLTNPEARRVRRITFQGRPIQPRQEFLLATNSYRAGGGGAFAGTGLDNTLSIPPEDIRTILTDWVRSAGRVRIPAVLNWRFAPVPGATGVFETSTRARDYVAGVPLPVVPVGPADSEYTSMRLRLSGEIDRRLANPRPAPYMTP